MPDEILKGTESMDDLPLPGTLDGPHLKRDGQYLTNPTWIGEAVPEWYMGYPWGLGGECWYVRAFGTHQRRVFAGMDAETCVTAAQDWLKQEGRIDG